MFLKIKKIFPKNLISLSLLFVSAILLVSPKFLDISESKKTSQENKKISKEQIKAKQENTQSVVKTDQSELNSTALPKNRESDSLNQQKVQGTKTQTQIQEQKPSTEGKISKVVSLSINTGVESYSFKVDWVDGMTVWDVLNKAHEENGFSLKASWYGNPLNSYYITEIHGKNCECWTYKLNGQGLDHEGKPLKGASLVKVKENDIIVWTAN